MTHMFIAAEERSEMIRAHAGIVTGFINDDRAARAEQIKGILQDHIDASRGDVGVFAARMAKQLEAGAFVTRHVLMSLATRMGATDAEVHQIFAEVYTEFELED
ncbi:hypothetical protein [Agromyces sp. NPDC057865]|uniref:hypothetical protein n=1 Tax=Agromyces sp. NPDC057865 TaxID=3346267 RepID=UPI00366CC7DF